MTTSDFNRYPDTQNAPVNVSIYGYCDISQSAIKSLFCAGSEDELRHLRGEYTIICERADEVTIITSPIGAIHYYYAIYKEKLFHGSKLSTILKNSQLPWEWNWRALGDLSQLENLTENHTLHPSIHRVPPGTLLRFRDTKLEIHSFQYIDTIPRFTADPAEAVDALNDEVSQWSGSNPYLSLSGGFDSRVILSAMLRQGIRPHLVTTGSSESSDVKVSRKIADKIGLEHHLIPISLDDFFQHAEAISDVTNGSKPACHWHTYLYPLNAKISKDARFFVGTLGEFARNYYFDKGKLGVMGNIFPDQALKALWRMKQERHPTFFPHELKGLNPFLKNELDPSGIERRVSRQVAFCHHQFLSGLTRYYLEQRVPNFYANGIAMYMASSQWRSPFHSRRWLDIIWNLPISWKLGSNWHRFAIQRNYPSLLAFPEENGFSTKRMLKKAPPLYWTPFMKRAHYTTYDQSEDWYRSPRMQEFISESLPLIEDVIDPHLIQNILKSHMVDHNRTRTISFLLTMIFWMKNVRSL